MTFTTRSRRTKLFAKVMVLIWLFGFVVAVANACVAPDLHTAAPRQQQHGGTPSVPCAQHPLEDATAADEPAARIADESVACPPACKSFCDAAQSTVAKSNSLDASNAVPPLGPMAAWRVPPVARAQSAWRTTAAALPPGPPATILFGRLTI